MTRFKDLLPGDCFKFLDDEDYQAPAQIYWPDELPYPPPVAPSSKWLLAHSFQTKHWDPDTEVELLKSYVICPVPTLLEDAREAA